MKILVISNIIKVIILVTVITLIFTGYNVVNFSNELVSSIDERETVITQVINYETIIKYDSSVPLNVSRISVEGMNGLTYIDASGVETVLSPVVNEEKIIGTGKTGVYTGIMTGYGPDCSTCDGRGYTACKTSDLGWYNILNHGTHYDDSEFGSVRVLAADLSEFPCGTIIEVDSTNAGKFMGIVLDTGYDMRKNFANGIIHFDVAFMTEDDPDLRFITNMKSVNYNVQRWGF